jgi:hypothetical protein
LERKPKPPADPAWPTEIELTEEQQQELQPQWEKLRFDDMAARLHAERKELEPHIDALTRLGSEAAPAVQASASAIENLKLRLGGKLPPPGLLERTKAALRLRAKPFQEFTAEELQEAESLHADWQALLGPNYVQVAETLASITPSIVPAARRKRRKPVRPAPRASDPFATQEQREAAIKQARAAIKRPRGSATGLAERIKVAYTDLRAWVRDRGKPSLAKGASTKVDRIEKYLLRYVSANVSAK